MSHGEYVYNTTEWDLTVSEGVESINPAETTGGKEMGMGEETIMMSVFFPAQPQSCLRDA